MKYIKRELERKLYPIEIKEECFDSMQYHIRFRG